MLKLDTLCQTLSQIAPLPLAESWDNVGLLVGDRSQSINNVMTCLTISPTVVDEAIERSVGLIVAHHPLPFQPLKKITADNITGKMLLRLIGGNVAVYSAHTAYDSAAEGINQIWADRLGLVDIAALIDPVCEDGKLSENALGAGRFGRLPNPTSAGELLRELSESVGANCPRLVGKKDHQIKKVAFACGSGGTFLAAARRKGCDALITGEANFHSCLEAESSGIALGLLGHYWSERFAMELMAEKLSAEHPDLTIWPSKSETDPIEPL